MGGSTRGPGMKGDYAIKTVAALGLQAPPNAIQWVAGWVAFVYSQEANSKVGSVSTPGAQRGQASAPWHEALKQGEVDPNAFGQRGAIDPNTWYNQGRAGGSASSLFSKSIAENTKTTASETKNLVSAVKELTTVVKTGQNSVNSRAAGVP